MRFLAFAALLAFIAPAHADVQADTSYVIETHLTLHKMPQRLDSLHSETVPAIAQSINAMGGTIIDLAAFEDALLKDFVQEATDFTRCQYIDALQEFFSAEEITLLADFYRSPDGKIWLDTLVNDVAFADATGQHLNGPLAGFVEYPLILSEIEQAIVRHNTTRLTELFNLARIANILTEDSIVAFESEEQRQTVVDQMIAHARN